MRFPSLAAAVLAVILPVGATSAAPDLDRIELPDGFKIEVWAEVDGARSMAVGDGFVIVGTQGEDVWAVPFDNATMKAGAAVNVADNLKVANGVALHEGVLYIGEQPRVVRWGDAPFDVKNPKQAPVQVGPDLVDNPWHGWRYIAFGPDGKLYVSLGAPCNICMPKDLEGRIIRMNADGTDVEDVALGVLNSVGLEFHPGNGDLYFTDNGADMMGDEADDPLAILRRQAFTRIGQAFVEAVDPKPPIRVQHHLDDACVFEKAGDGRTERGAQHSRAACDTFRIVMRSRHLIPDFDGDKPDGPHAGMIKRA